MKDAFGNDIALGQEVIVGTYNRGMRFRRGKVHTLQQTLDYKGDVVESLFITTADRWNRKVKRKVRPQSCIVTRPWSSEKTS